MSAPADSSLWTTPVPLEQPPLPEAVSDPTVTREEIQQAVIDQSSRFSGQPPFDQHPGRTTARPVTDADDSLDAAIACCDRNSPDVRVIGSVRAKTLGGLLRSAKANEAAARFLRGSGAWLMMLAKDHWRVKRHPQATSQFESILRLLGMRRAGRGG